MHTGVRSPAVMLTHWEGEPLSVWREVWGVPRLEAYASVSSTNDRVRALAADGAPPFTVVVAEAQTAGRGRSGRAWHSPPGMGLWVSLLLEDRPPGGSGRGGVAPILLGLALARAIHEVVPTLRPGLKWPNDLVLEGKKVAGILCETLGGGGVVAGIGVNVRQSPDDFPEELREVATSLEAACACRVARGELAGRLLAEAQRLLDPIPEEIDTETSAALAALDTLRGRRVECEAGAIGIAAGIDRSGALLVERDDHEIARIHGGSVRVLGEADRD